VSGVGSAARGLLLRAVSAPWLSRWTGRLADLRVPGPLLRAAIRGYSRLYAVDWSEVAEPLEGFPTFNAFFTRRLREGARAVAGGPCVVSPSDSRLSAFGAIPGDGRLEQIKGRSYSIGALLGSAEDAALFRGGFYATLYLSPSMYHRVHSPVDGRILSWRYLPGRLFPVNAMAVRSVEGLFTVNERVAVFMETDAFGPVAVVLVGATNVGRITLGFTDLVTNVGRAAVRTEASSPIPIARGAELGVFNLGSTVVLLVANPALRPAGPASGDLVRMGQALWQRREEKAHLP
jgi:phosphatidylserine decarboxylase